MRMIVVIALVIVAGALLGCALQADGEAANMAKPPSGTQRIFELRTYTASPGKLEALSARFRDHTDGLFAKHAMTVIGYFTPADGPRQQDTLIYILAFPDREARESAWNAFRDDPEWKKVKAESEVNGPLTAKIESVILEPTNYSPTR